MKMELAIDGLYLIPRHQLFGIGMEIDLLVHPFRHRAALQVMLQQRQGHDQWHEPLAAFLDEAW